MVNKQVFQRVSRTLLCFLTAALFMASIPASAAVPESTLIILLDVSGSMNTNDPYGQAIQWAEELCANCIGLGINVKVITFSSESSQLDPVNGNIPDQLEELQVDGYSGKTTDHFSAINLAAQSCGQNSAAQVGIVMLSDGALDLIGRGANVEGSFVPQDAARTEKERETIDKFMDKCEDLGNSGCELLLVGFGEKDGDLDDPYAVSGFGMFQNVDGKNNCKFLRATDIWNESIIQHLFAMFGLSNSESMELPIENGVIRFALPQDYYKVNLCINKQYPGKESAPLEENQFEITWSREVGDSVGEDAFEQVGENAFHIMEYDSFIFLSLNSPKTGAYEIVLPEQLENIYTIARKLNIDLPFLSIELTGDNMEPTCEDPLTYKISRQSSRVECELKINFGNTDITAGDISSCSYTLTPRSTSEMQNSGEVGTPQDIPLGELNSGSYIHTIPLPVQNDAIDAIDTIDAIYDLQVCVKKKDGTDVYSNVIRIEVVSSPPIPERIEKNTNEKITISPSVLWPEITEVDSLQHITYFINGKEAIVPCNTDEYQITGNLEEGITLEFKQAQDYCLVMQVYGVPRAHCLYQVTEPDNRNYTMTVAEIAVIAIIVIAVIVIIAVIYNKKKHRRNQTSRK